MQVQPNYLSRSLVTLLAALLLTSQAFAADKFDFSGFDAGEQFIAQWAVRNLEAHEDCHAYVTVNQLGLDVLRLSNKPLGRPSGNHPEMPPPASDLFLAVGGTVKSPKVMAFVKARVTEHNQRLKDNLKNDIARVASVDPSLSKTTQNPVRRPEIPLTDLDRVLQLISQGGVVNSEYLPTSNADFDDVTGISWKKKVEALQAAGGAAGEAARKLKPAIEDVQAATDGYQQAVKKSSEAAGKVPPRFAAAEQLRDDPLYGASGNDLQMLEAQGGQTSIRAREYQAKQEAAMYETFLSFGERIAAGYPAMDAALAMMQYRYARADVRRHQAAVETLVPALGARAGARIDQAELDVKYAVVPRGLARFPDEPMLYAVIRSRSARELTQLTVLVKIESDLGTRYATYFIPSLPPGASGRFQPVTLSKAALSDQLGNLGGQPNIAKIRYAAWCNQFQATSQELTKLSTEQMVTDIWLQSVQPGLSYVSLGGSRDGKKEAKRRFELIFRRVSPSTTGFATEFDMIDHENNDRATRYHGTLTLPPVKLGREGQVLHAIETSKFGYVQKDEDETLLIKATAGNEKLELKLQGRWNVMPRKWQIRFSSFGLRDFVPAGQVPTADSPEEKSSTAAKAVRPLIEAGKFEEAKAALEKVIRDFPDQPGATEAKFMLSRLDQVKAGQAKAREMQEARDKFKQDNNIPPGRRGPPPLKK
ncbi:tetratricopeptide repeat protein [Anatilimnocola floriformis]|uniref:tetratricopeptide repeat protein n=1 Tax=Anatilimnocola floriformis TaxID=2948575 RepID=UPI0020C5678C|nr:hypothetical protein [Anatilimnocola floriformis]